MATASTTVTAMARTAPMTPTYSSKLGADEQASSSGRGHAMTDAHVAVAAKHPAKTRMTARPLIGSVVPGLRRERLGPFRDGAELPRAPTDSHRRRSAPAAHLAPLSERASRSAHVSFGQTVSVVGGATALPARPLSGPNGKGRRCMRRHQIVALCLAVGALIAAVIAPGVIA